MKVVLALRLLTFALHLLLPVFLLLPAGMLKKCNKKTQNTPCERLYGWQIAVRVLRSVDGSWAGTAAGKPRLHVRRTAVNVQQLNQKSISHKC